MKQKQATPNAPAAAKSLERPPWRPRSNGGLATIAGITLTWLAALAVAAPATCESSRPMPEGPFAPELMPPSGVSPAQMLVAAQIYDLLALVLWLAAGGFVAGLLVGALAQRRAEAWAALAVATFLGIIAVTGVGAMPAMTFLPLTLAGGVLVLSAAASGGWLGQHIWRAVSRRSAPSPPDNLCG